MEDLEGHDHVHFQPKAISLVLEHSFPIAITHASDEVEEQQPAENGLVALHLIQALMRVLDQNNVRTVLDDY